jgi:gamma-glutamylcyclotransferase (GGCT)/AIG2-like uncharacterized protein YtfP
MPRGENKMLYYFSYGLPLFDRSIDRRVQTLRPEGQGRLDGWSLTFRRPGGKPNLTDKAGASVWGCVYLIEERHLPELDREEPGAQRHHGNVLREGKLEPAVFYVYPEAEGVPDREFVESFRGVYTQAGLPQSQIDRALAR